MAAQLVEPEDDAFPGVTYRFTMAELAEIEDLAVARHNPKAESGYRDLQIHPEARGYSIHMSGVKGEWAVSKLLGVEFTQVAGSGIRKQRWSMKLGRKKIAVRTATWHKGRFLMPWKQFKPLPVHIGVLVRERDATWRESPVDVIGWFDSEDWADLCYPQPLGKRGVPTYVFPNDRLRNFLDLMPPEQQERYRDSLPPPSTPPALATAPEAKVPILSERERKKQEFLRLQGAIEFDSDLSDHGEVVDPG